MGKGDRRSRRSKIWRGTYGKFRPRKKKKNQQKRIPISGEESRLS
jgi:30S ribosomal protein S31